MAYNIVVIAGSLRKDSFSLKVANALAKLAPASLKLEVITLAGISFFNQDLEGAPPADWLAFRDKLQKSDGVLFVTPEYNRAIPGVLKNAIDWASRPRVTSPLRDKPVAIMGASPGRGSTARAQAQLREAFVFTGACVMPLPELMVGAAGEHFDADGNLIDSAVRASLGELLEALRAWTLRIDVRRAAAHPTAACASSPRGRHRGCRPRTPRRQPRSCEIGRAHV